MDFELSPKVKDLQRLRAQPEERFLLCRVGPLVIFHKLQRGIAYQQGGVTLGKHIR